MVPGTADVADLDIEKNENQFFGPNREMPRGRRAKDEFTQVHIAEEGFWRVGGDDTETLGPMAMRSPNLLEGGIHRV